MFAIELAETILAIELAETLLAIAGGSETLLAISVSFVNQNGDSFFVFFVFA